MSETARLTFPNMLDGNKAQQYGNKGTKKLVFGELTLTAATGTVDCSAVHGFSTIHAAAASIKSTDITGGTAGDAVSQVTTNYSSSSDVLTVYAWSYGENTSGVGEWQADTGGVTVSYWIIGEV